MKYPSIPVIDNWTEFLDLVSNSKETHARAKLILDAQEILNQTIKRHDQITDIEQFRSQAQTMMAEAQETRKQANDYALSVRAKADEDAKINMDKLKVQHQNLNKRTNDLSRWEDDLRAKEADLAVREELVAKDLESSHKIELYAKTLSEESLAVKKDYQDRLDKLKGFAA